MMSRTLFARIRRSNLESLKKCEKTNAKLQSRLEAAEHGHKILLGRQILTVGRATLLREVDPVTDWDKLKRANLRQGLDNKDEAMIRGAMERWFHCGPCGALELNTFLGDCITKGNAIAHPTERRNLTMVEGLEALHAVMGSEPTETEAIFASGLLQMLMTLRGGLVHNINTPYPAPPSHKGKAKKQSSPQHQTTKVGIDASLLPLNESLKLQGQLRTKGGDLIGQEHNLIDGIWSDRPSPLSNPVIIQPVAYAGSTASDKLQDMRSLLRKKEAVGFVISSLDDIAWLFNLRGSDVPFNPIFFAYAIITLTSSTLFLDSANLSEEVLAHLPRETKIEPYADIFEASRTLGKSSGKILISSKGSWALANALGSGVERIRSPIADAKSIKNCTETKGMKDCHVRDGAALVEYFYQLSKLAASQTQIDEVDAATLLEQHRAQKPHFMGLSFPTISSTGANGAVIHYKPEKQSCSIIDWSKIYLCDSGAQYRDGTTDITQTWHFKSPSKFEKQAFTAVLKGHIAIATAVFPRGTTGYTIDSFARQHLWKLDLDYFHGTSHGVGSFVNVHEPPLGIGTRIMFNEVPLSPGNVISNEPGFYLDGQFGIRIENIIDCEEKKTPNQFGGREYLGFKTISLAPLCKNLIETKLLSREEKIWVDEYYKQVLNTIGSEVDTEVLAWLRNECSPL